MLDNAKYMRVVLYKCRYNICLFSDMEKEGDLPSGVRSEYDSFCGGFSLLNPRNLFLSENAYSLAIFKHVRD